MLTCSFPPETYEFENVVININGRLICKYYHCYYDIFTARPSEKVLDIIESLAHRFLEMLPNLVDIKFNTLDFFGNLEFVDDEIKAFPLYFVLSGNGCYLYKIDPKDVTKIALISKYRNMEDVLNFNNHLNEYCAFNRDDEDDDWDDDEDDDWNNKDDACDVNGNIFGDVNRNVDGDVNGNIVGDINGNIKGDVNGNVAGAINGNIDGDVNGNIGTVNGNIKGDVNGNIGIVNGNVNGDVNGNVGMVNGRIQGEILGHVGQRY